MDILDSAAELFENSLARLGIDKETARCETTGLICELAFLFGGQLVYIKKTRNSNAVAERNQRKRFSPKISAITGDDLSNCEGGNMNAAPMKLTP